MSCCGATAQLSLKNIHHHTTEAERSKDEQCAQNVPAASGLDERGVRTGSWAQNTTRLDQDPFQLGVT